MRCWFYQNAASKDPCESTHLCGLNRAFAAYLALIVSRNEFIKKIIKKVSEYDQEIQQSYTANPEKDFLHKIAIISVSIDLDISCGYL